ncbi:hypothetical protein MKL26_09445, partial [Streptococcus suis]|nr:hypothetical protein [Streptococcus suis]
ITQKCQAKNAAIQSKFEERKQQVSEKIKDSLATYGLTAVFSSLDHSLKRLVDQQGLFESLSQSGQLRYPFSYDETPYVHDTRLNLALYDSELHSLKSKARSVSQSCQNERAGWFDSIIGRSTLLKSWKIIDDASRKLLKESDTVFEGSGLREGKSDGISQSLHEVFSVQLPDIAELERMTDNTLELIRGVAAHFTAVDTWLGENLKNGHFQGSGGTVQIPTSYQAYLERTGILDDVKDVLQAFDKQVEERSKKYAQQVAIVYSSTFQQLSGSLGHWSTEVSTFHSLAETICARFPTSIYVERQRIVDKKPTTSWTYWGNMRALYPATIRASLETAKQELATILPQLTDASQQIQTAQFRLGNMQGELGRIVEQGVYRALDLDELTDSQKIVANLLDKMISELSFVRNTIESNMSGRAAQALAGQVQALNQRLGYYQQLVSDCFGTQTNPVAVASSQPTLSRAAAHFSLNGYRPI